MSEPDHGTRKWLFGPRGTGFVRGRATAWQRAPELHQLLRGGPDRRAERPRARRRTRTPGGFPLETVVKAFAALRR
ncbi:hypothetical protein [Nonomuraea typhae]|uniref:hypothetical protein n=1 Tax=Nonomuraea typhae TaxID=2603600 RepID=UPI0012FA9829|nr:hypothetical protein [Nonomuraea typhae]